MWALGHAALVAGTTGEAIRWLGALRETLVAAGVAEPGEMPWLIDEIEALVAADRRPEAEGVVDLLASLAERVDRASALAAAARGRAPRARRRAATPSASGRPSTRPSSASTRCPCPSSRHGPGWAWAVTTGDATPGARRAWR